MPHRRQIQPFKRPIDDRPRGHQGPTVSVESVWKSQFVGGKAMGKTMHPYLAVPGVGIEPHTSFGQPRLRRDFVGSGFNTAAPMLQSMTYEVFVEVHQHSNAESGSTHVKGILSVGTSQSAKHIPMIRLVFLRTRVEEFAKQASKSAPNRPARVQFLTPFRGSV